MPKKFLKNNWILIILIIFFSLLLWQGIGQIYHQDEYRWAALADGTGAVNPQPPLTLFLLKAFGRLFGYDHLRILPAIFAVLNLILVYFISKKLSAKKSIALLAALFFSFNVYSLIAGLQIDIDGAILPFFVLLCYNAYLRVNENRRFWLPVIAVTLAGGFLTKLSFFVFIAALALDYALNKKQSGDWQFGKILKTLASLSLLVLALAGLFYFISPEYFRTIVAYAGHFKITNFTSRAYLDLVFKIFKSLVLLSPLLTLAIFYALSRQELRQKYRFWLVYLLFNFLFYTVLFDFSTLTVERYFMFMIAPACIIAAGVISPFLNLADFKLKKWPIVFMVIVFAVLALGLIKSGHKVLPLNPKMAYLQHFESLNLSFLIPFTGGSGPIGFYQSAKFIFVFWLASLLFFVWLWARPRNRPFLVTMILAVTLVYNIVFINEFLYGWSYGSVPKIARQTVDYVNASPEIKKVITYYDIATYNLLESGKYDSRFYTASTRDYTKKLTEYRGHYMIVDFPAIGKDSLYWQLLSRCPIIKSFQDKKIDSYIFDCRKLK